MFAPMLECTLQASSVSLAGGLDGPADLLPKACPSCPEIVASHSSCSATALHNEDHEHRGATGRDKCREGVYLCVFVRIGDECLAPLPFSELRAVLQVLQRDPTPAALTTLGTQLSRPLSKSHARAHGCTHARTHTRLSLLPCLWHNNAGGMRRNSEEVDSAGFMTTGGE